MIRDWKAKVKILPLQIILMPSLMRHVGTREAIFYGLGVIIGAGIYVLIAPASGEAGNAVWLSFLIAASLATLTGLSYAELGSMFPKSAAEYVYVHHAYRSRFISFLMGWLIIFTGVVSISAVSLGFTGYLADLLGVSIEESRHIVPMMSLGLIALMSFVNFLGIRETSRLNIAMTSIVIVGLLIIIGIGLPSFGSIDYFEMPMGFDGVLLAASLIFFAYLGFEEIVNIAEETRRPRKVMPRAIIWAVIISTALYILTSVSVVSLVGWEFVSQSSAPLAEVAGTVLGDAGKHALSTIALFATGSVVLGLILVVSRMIWGMSRERALPKFLSKIHSRGTPLAAIVSVAIGSSIFVFLGDIGHVASVTSMGAIVIFIAVNGALIWLRFSKPKLHRPFRVPLNAGKFPLIGAAGVVIGLVMLVQFSLELLLTGAFVIFIGALVFLIYKRRDYVLLRQVEGLFSDIKKRIEK
jgi:APA family basic amino acid/polyamine antiporter